MTTVRATNLAFLPSTQEAELHVELLLLLLVLPLQVGTIMTVSARAVVCLDGVSEVLVHDAIRIFVSLSVLFGRVAVARR